MVDDFRAISRKCGKKLEKYRDFFRNHGLFGPSVEIRTRGLLNPIIQQYKNYCRVRQIQRYFIHFSISNITVTANILLQSSTIPHIQSCDFMLNPVGHMLLPL